MTKQSPSKIPWKSLLLAGGILYIIDQVSKFLIVWNFSPPDYLGAVPKHAEWCIPIIDGVFNIVRVHNTGVAFGIGNGTAWATYVFLAIPVLALVALYYGFKRGFFSTVWMKIAGMLLAVGICGNLTDRLVQGFITWGEQGAQYNPKGSILMGYVVDFLDVTIPIINYRWPAFNVADSCICVAASILFLHGIFYKDAKKEQSL